MRNTKLYSSYIILFTLFISLTLVLNQTTTTSTPNSTTTTSTPNSTTTTSTPNSTTTTSTPNSTAQISTTTSTPNATSPNSTGSISPESDSNASADVNYSDIINETPLVPVPTSLSGNSTELRISLYDAFTRLNLEFSAYFMNKCTDDRVEGLFGKQNSTLDTTFKCMDLIYDWAQVYAPYKCNNWFCNLKGVCSSKTDDIGFIIPSCVCNAGYTGQNCMFNQTTYNNANDWLNYVKQWLQNYLAKNTQNNTITQKEVVSDLLDVTQMILLFSSNVNVNDLDKYANIISVIASSIMNSKVTMDSELEEKLFDFMDFISSNIDSSLQGVDPTQIVALANETVKVTDQYELQKADIPVNSDLNLSPKDMAVNKTLRFLNSDLNDLSGNIRRLFEKNEVIRLLQQKSAAAIKKPVKKKVVNPDSAKVFMPQNLTSALSNSAVAFVSYKDPSAMTQINSVSISSQVVNMKVTNKANGAIVPYPSSNIPYQIYLPWASVPFNIANNKYVDNCKVYSFDGKTWIQTNSCKVLASTNSAATNIECSTFGTLGVSCTGASVPIKKTNGSSLLSVSSLVIYAIFGLFLF